MKAASCTKAPHTIQRMVRLLALNDDLLKMVDDKRLSENPAYEISFLDNTEQARLFDYLMAEDRMPTVAQAMSLKQHSQALKAQKDKARPLIEAEVASIMLGNRLQDILPPTEKELAQQRKEQAEKETATPPQPPVTPPPAEPGRGAETPSAPAQPEPQGIHVQSATQQKPPIVLPSQAGKSDGAPVQGAQGLAAASTTHDGQAGISNTPSPAAEQQQNPPDGAHKAFIRSEYMAELREDNVILPKGDIKTMLPPCRSNEEYVVAIKAALVEAQVKKLDTRAADSATKKVEDKPAPAIRSAISTPTTQIINRAEAREVAEKAVKTEKPPAGKAPEPGKADKGDKPSPGIEDFLKSKAKPNKTKELPKKPDKGGR